jgi:hypothetical protein
VAYLSIHHVRLSADKSTVKFDVRPTEFVLLNEGSAECIAALLKSIGIEVIADHWSVQRFCTPYYADDDHAAAVHDRYKQAFHVEVSLRAAFDGPEFLPFKSWSSDALDSTWDPPKAGGAFVWTELPCVVIGDFVDGNADSALNDPALSHGRPTVAQLGQGVAQVRIDAGRLSASGSDDVPRQLVAVLGAKGASMNWRLSRTRCMQRG